MPSLTTYALICLKSMREESDSGFARVYIQGDLCNGLFISEARRLMELFPDCFEPADLDTAALVGLDR